MPAGQLPGDLDTHHFDQLGVIEVIVLRCRAKEGEPDDGQSGSGTHDSILGDIDDPVREDTRVANEPAGNQQPTVIGAPEEVVGRMMSGLPFGGDGTNDQAHRFGLDGEAPLGGKY